MPTAALGPQLLSRASEPPNGDGWVYEIKYDGFRMVASLERGRALLRSRPGADWTSRLPGIAKAVESLGADGLRLDGELVYLSNEGFPDFERLRAATQSEDRGRLYYQVFDLLSIGGTDLTARPLLERKERLVELLRRVETPRLRYVAHTDGNGAEFFRAVDGLGLEGIVCKRARSVYRSGVRSADWVKVKCFRTQTFSVVGYTIEDGLLATLALAGCNEAGQLCYAGRVEFGVPRRDDTLLRILRTMGTPNSEIAGTSTNRSIMWIEPQLSAEVRALAWKPGQYLRHAVLRTIAAS